MPNPKLLNYFETKIKALLSRKVDKIPGKGLSTEDFTTAEKQKLAGLTPITVDDNLSSASENPVESQAIYSVLQGKVDVESGKGLSTEDYTTEEKAKLAGIATGATAVTVDTALDSTSENPVQNKAVKIALDSVVETGTWTPHLYDNNTFVRVLGDQSFYKIQNTLVLIPFYFTHTDFSGVNTMLQIRNLPISHVWGGMIYINQSAAGNYGAGITIQAADYDRVYFRPNVKSSMFSDPTDVGITGFIIGMV